MLETGRRSAISTSELGLYSDRGDRYRRSRYGPVVRKFVIGVMVVVVVILAAIFLYDFTSSTSSNSKLNQETKHIYILQNALKKVSNSSRKFTNATSTVERDIDRSELSLIQDRSDDEDRKSIQHSQDTSDDEVLARETIDPEFRAQNLNNFKLRKRVLKSVENENEDEAPEGKQLFDNHAVVYRVRQRYKHPDSEEQVSSEENRPTPFHWEFKTPHPMSFKRPKYPQLSQYRYPHSSRNIQDIIKYLTNDAEVPNRGIKFTGVYVNPKKYDLYPEVGEMMSNSDRSEEEENAYPVSFTGDPFYQYKPKHPADVNLLATSNVRFSPTGLHRYNSHYDPFYIRPNIAYTRPTSTEAQFDNTASYATGAFTKKRKPKPFSVMLDIYPITDIVEQSKMTTRPRPQISLDDYDSRKPIQFNRNPKLYASVPPPIPVVAVPNQSGLSDEEERQQMIFHLNLYPRRKGKLSRHDIIHRSETMRPEERQQFMEKIMSPLESIAKHLTVHSAIEQSKLNGEDEDKDDGADSITRYQENPLDEFKQHVNTEEPNEGTNEKKDKQNFDVDVTIPTNHRIVLDEDYASTERYENEVRRNLVSSTEYPCESCENSTTITNGSKAEDSGSNVDTVEGFKRFSDGLSATE